MVEGESPGGLKQLVDAAQEAPLGRQVQWQVPRGGTQVSVSTGLAQKPHQLWVVHHACVVQGALHIKIVPLNS